MRILVCALLLFLMQPAPAVSHAMDPLAPGEHRVDVRGVELWYLVRGSGPVLVVQPGGAGWGGDATVYIETLAPLEATRTVVYLEPRGVGRSGRSADPALYSLDSYVQDLEKLRRHLGLERMDLAGHSHGGFVILHYALAYPDRVDRLLLLNTGVFVDELDPEWLAQRPGYAEAQARLDAADPDRPADELHADVIRTLLPVLHFHDYGPVRERVDDLLARTTFSAEPFQQFGREMAAFDLRDRVAGIRARSLIVVGDDDMPDLREGSFLMYQRIAGAQLFVVPACGHWPMIERPELFFPAVSRFLADPPARP